MCPDADDTSMWGPVCFTCNISSSKSENYDIEHTTQTHIHCLYLTWLGLSSPETLVFNCDDRPFCGFYETVNSET